MIMAISITIDGKYSSFIGRNGVLEAAYTIDPAPSVFMTHFQYKPAPCQHDAPPVDKPAS